MRLAPFALVAAIAALPVACTEPRTPANAALSAGAQQWLDRSRASFSRGDFDDARDAAESAVAAAPKSTEAKVQAAKVHLARLEYAEVERVLKDVDGVEARGLRGRARWYADELEPAADDLDAVLADPASKDEWAKAISKLARRGVGRKPFQISGGLLAPVPMPRVRGTHLVVPVEIDGEQALALIATGKGEVVLDSTTRKEPSWVQLRFGERITVKDVPTLVEDLSGISKELGAPIKALLGVNLLRRLSVTFDYGGEQFVVRTRAPSPPPNATRLSVNYALGGAMITRVVMKQGSAEMQPVLVNTLLPYPIALDDEGWRRAGVDLASLTAAPAGAGAISKAGRLPFLKLGAFDVPEVPGVLGPSFADVAGATSVDVHGAVGSGILAAFRCTLTDDGRALWLEDLPEWLLRMMEEPMFPTRAPAGPAPAGSGAPPAGKGAPAAPPHPSGERPTPQPLAPAAGKAGGK
ncbi:MAG: hypothetical protein IT374_18515 [Polyangiaceae bacterium]|nr:hypothetical protein [Polyangiaceae bacterium]